MQSVCLPISLQRLSAEARDWLLAKSAAMGITPTELIRLKIREAAEAEGFAPKGEQTDSANSEEE